MRIRVVIIFALTAACVAAARGQDPAVVNAKTIKVRFENDRVRVLEANLPPGVKEQVHSHPAYVIYVLEGGRYRNYASDGKVTEGELKTGEVLFREPLTHAAENIGDKTLHMILVELKVRRARKQRLLAEAGRRIGSNPLRFLTPNLAVHWMRISIACALVTERTTALRTTWRRRRPERQLEIDATSGILNSGYAPPKDAEAAILATLQPGNYTAIVCGNNNTTGVALVEVYNPEAN